MSIFARLFGRHTGAAGVAAPQCPDAARPGKKGITKEQIDQFIQCTQQGPVVCSIRIEDVSELLSALQLHLVKQRMSMAQVLNFIDENLVGACPVCRTHSAGKGLAALGAFQGMMSQGIKPTFGGDSGGGERLLVGQCRNAKCSSRLMLISWRPKGTPDSPDKPVLSFAE